MLNKTFKYTGQSFFEPTKQPSINVDQVLLALCIVSGILTVFLG